MRRSAPRPMNKAHTLSVSQVVAFPNVLRSQVTIESMIPSRAAAALPAKLAWSGSLRVDYGTGALPRRRDPSARLPQCFSGGFPLHSGVSPRPLCRAPGMPPIYNQGAPAISAVHRCHQPHIFGPPCLDPETGIFPLSQQWRSSCLPASSKVSRSRTGYSRSCLRGTAHRYSSLRCRNCQRGASSGPQVPSLFSSCKPCKLSPDALSSCWMSRGGSIGGSGRSKSLSFRPVGVERGVLESDIIHRCVNSGC